MIQVHFSVQFRHNLCLHAFKEDILEGACQLVPAQEILMILQSLELIPKTGTLSLTVALSCLLHSNVYALT